MKIMIDFHGTINIQPDMFRTWLKVIKPHHDIYICSGGRRKEISEKLTNIQFQKDIHYTEILSITDFLEQEFPELIKYDDNHVWVEDSFWWSIKGKFCKTLNIDLMIDDSPQYFKYVPENTICIQFSKETLFIPRLRNEEER